MRTRDVSARMRGPAFAVAFMLTAVHQSPAQTSGFASGVGGYAVQPRLVLQQGDLRETLAGTWLGGAARVRIGAFAIRGMVAVGKLTASGTSPATLDRDGAEASAEADLWLTGGFALSGGIRLRGFATDVGTQTWRMLRAGIRVSAPLGGERLRGYLSSGFLPRVTVSGQNPTKLAFDVDVGVVAVPFNLPLELICGYRMERFDFGNGPGDRIEEFASWYAGASLGRLW